MKKTPLSLAVTALLTALAALLFPAGCVRGRPTLRLGIIAPSLNHLPLSYALEAGGRSLQELQIIAFSSGWETQEALVSGRIDAAIMPFSYAFTAASRGYPLRIVSFWERESDALACPSGIAGPAELEGARIGLLKASSLDLLLRHWAQAAELAYQPVYFHSPNELVAALQTGQVQGIVAYVPLLQKLGAGFRILHWFGSDHPLHPCCDLVVNTSRLTPPRKGVLRQLLALLEETIPALDTPAVYDYAAARYGLDPAQARQALEHTKFRAGLDRAGQDFELRLMQEAVEMGYLSRVPAAGEIYLELD